MYQIKIKEYHPDKISIMAKDIHQLAFKRTK